MKVKLILVLALVLSSVFVGAAPAQADCTSEVPENYEEGPGSSELVTVDEDGDVHINASNASYYVRATGGVVVQWVDCID